ncbi:Y-family DNA polymerase [Aestuariibacter salexigens]|uniref:Y-family DNA polymerase n=1 Tax=Aestuariibacter salexigens TaxID=226010 RepID=UPI00040DBB81|nr:DNA polymerase Y family protein [Aestuariibacter salexigens]
MSPIWLYLHFPNLQLNTLFSGNTGSHETLPVVVLDAKKNQVCQRNGSARKLGIQCGMGLATASSLSQQLQVVSYCREVEESQLNVIAETLYQLTSDICFFQPDGLALRIHNMLNLYGGLQPYWNMLREHLTRLHIEYQASTAWSPLAARVMARNQINTISDQRDNIKTALGQCTIDSLDIHNKDKQKLKRVGLHTVADIVALPLKDIARRFDSYLVTYLGRLKGELHHPLPFFHPPEYFYRYLELLYEIEKTDTLIPPVKRLLNELESFLKIRNHTTSELTLTLYQRDHTPLEVTLGSAQCEYRAQSWLKLLSLKFESVTLTAPVYAISIRVDKLQELNPVRQDMFAGKQAQISTLQLRAILEAKLGASAVQQLCYVSEHRPEYSQKQVPLSDTDVDAASVDILPDRPGFLLSEPLPLQEKVTVIRGPERISTGWWDNQQAVRDYFIARNQFGQLLWIFRTPHNYWYQHGLFC